MRASVLRISFLTGLTALTVWAGGFRVAPVSSQDETPSAQPAADSSEIAQKGQEPEKAADGGVPGIGGLKEEISSMKDRYGQMAKEEEQLGQTRNRLQKDVEECRKHVSARLVAFYKFKELVYIVPVLGTKNPVRSLGTLEGIYGSDLKLYTGFREKLSEIELVEQASSRLSQQEQELRKQLEDGEARLASARKSGPAPQPAGAEGERGDLQPQRQPPDQGESVVREALLPSGAIQYSPAPGRSISLLQGVLPLPTPGNIVDTFNSKNNSPSQTFLYNKGIVIQAPRGQAIRAIHEGRVVFSEWFKDYGKVMIIDHGDHYYSLMAHADRLLKKGGEYVGVGEEVGTVGNTGSLDGPKLYFELRHNGKPMNPLEWLAVHKSTRE